MARWTPDAGSRLQHAAVTLFAQRGFADVTVSDIAEAAGLTRRTFFRHFADKREVLFAVEEELPSTVERLFAQMPPELTVREVIRLGLTTVVAPNFTGLRDYLRQRRDIIRSDASLRERETRKSALIVEAGTAGFRARGLDAVDAVLAAQMAVAVMDTAVERWLDDDTEDLTTVLLDVADRMDGILTR